MRILFSILALVVSTVSVEGPRAQSHEEWVCGCRSGTKIASDSLSDGFTGAQTAQSFTNAVAGTLTGVSVTGGPFGSTSPGVRHWTVIIYDSAGTCAVGSELQQTYFLQPTNQVSAGTDPVDGFPLFDLHLRHELRLCSKPALLVLRPAQCDDDRTRLGRPARLHTRTPLRRDVQGFVLGISLMGS